MYSGGMRYGEVCGVVPWSRCPGILFRGSMGAYQEMCVLAAWIDGFEEVCHRTVVLPSCPGGYKGVCQVACILPACEGV
jgi:hypothetical protein